MCSRNTYCKIFAYMGCLGKLCNHWILVIGETREEFLDLLDQEKSLKNPDSQTRTGCKNRMGLPPPKFNGRYQSIINQLNIHTELDDIKIP